jgi:hypothetical protein
VVSRWLPIPPITAIPGVMTFIVNHAGTIYEKDMGEDTDAIAKAMTSFAPGKGWQKVDAE